MSDSIDIVILAAGEGKRMKSAIPKVLHQVDETPMLVYILNKCLSLPFAGKIVVVVSNNGPLIKKTVNGHFTRSQNNRILFARQSVPMGTGHALQSALEQYSSRIQSDSLLVLCGDMPLVRVETLVKMAELYYSRKPGAIVLTATLSNPAGYGRIIRMVGNRVRKIVEEKDATPAEKKVTEVNSGVYLFNRRLVEPLLEKIDSNNNQGEYYLTDVVELLNRKKKRVVPYTTDDPDEILGVNTRSHLAQVEQIRVRKRVHYWMERGVSFLLPASVYISDATIIGQDSVLEPGVCLKGKTVIGDSVRIGAYSILSNVKVPAGRDVPPFSRKTGTKR